MQAETDQQQAEKELPVLKSGLSWLVQNMIIMGSVALGLERQPISGKGAGSIPASSNFSQFLNKQLKAEFLKHGCPREIHKLP